jgi:penicillin-binding protein 1A
VTLRFALQKSLNIPTIKLQEEIGTRAVIQTARAVGIETPIPAFRSIALGTAEVTLEQLTYGFAVFANGGIRVEPMFITRIEDRFGNVLAENRPKKREVLDPEPVAVLNSMLASVMDRGTGAPARTMGFVLPAAGKTGTTDDYSDAWFVGFTPEVVAGVWVGYDQPHPIGPGMSGTRAALPMWTRMMLAATADAESLAIEVPDTIVRRQVCGETGLPATDHCPDVTVELFLPGTVPAERCYLHQTSFNLRLGDRWQNLRRPKDYSREEEERRSLNDPD